MGIYDREYYQEEPRGFRLGGPRMMVTNLVLINVAVYVAQIFFPGLTERLELRADLFTHPWEFYQFLTYGFSHDVGDVWHIIGNMAVLWFLGREVEAIYGQRQFLSFYLSSIVLAGLAWAILEHVIPLPSKILAEWNAGYPPTVIGASGGVMAVAMVFVMHYPRRMVYLYFLIPIPIWVLAAFFLASDMVGAISQKGLVASSAHLAGAGLGYLFYRTRWQLGSLLPDRWSWPALPWLRPRARIHRPDEEEDDESALKAEVDRILEKISRQGEASLSSRERRTLEDASRRYQQRRQQ